MTRVGDYIIGMTWTIDEKRAYFRERIKNSTIWLQSLKVDKPCVDCGQIYEPFCMDYDHIDPSTKIKAVSRMIRENAPKDRILAEIAKCELVCVLCHGDRTQKRFDIKSPIKKYSAVVSRNVAIINNKKNCPCAICGKQYAPHNMQFDHLDPNNKFAAISQLKGHKEEVLLAEITKCQVLCALCHRRKSILEQEAGEYFSMREPENKTIISIQKEEVTFDVSVLNTSFKKNKRSMLPEKEAALIQEYLRGTNISDIEKQFSTNRSNIYRILDRNNIQRTNNFTKWSDRPHTEETREKMSQSAKETWKNRKGHNSRTEQDEKDIINNYQNGSKITIICDKFNIPTNMLYALLKQHNIPKRRV